MKWLPKIHRHTDRISHSYSCEGKGFRCIVKHFRKSHPQHCWSTWSCEVQKLDVSGIHKYVAFCEAPRTSRSEAFAFAEAIILGKDIPKFMEPMFEIIRCP